MGQILISIVLIFSLSAEATKLTRKESHPVENLSKKIKAAEKVISNKPGNIKVREKLTELYILDKQFKKAVETLSPFAHEATIDGLYTLAKAYQMNKDYLNEIRTLESVASKIPNRFRPQFMLGQAYERNDQEEKAVKAYRKSVGFAKKHKPSYDAMLAIFMKRKNMYESRIIINDMIRLFGEKGEFFTYLCEIYARDGFLEQAVKNCQKAIRKKPKEPANHIFLAQAYGDKGKNTAAQRVYSNAARQFKRDEFVQWRAGEFFFQNNNYPAAVRYLNNAVKADKKSARSHLGLALALFEMGNYEKSLTSFISSCKIDKSNESLHSYRTAIAKLREQKRWKVADKFTSKENLCRR